MFLKENLLWDGSGSGDDFAAYMSYIDPSTASLDESVLMVCTVLVGALLLVLIPDLLRFGAIPDAIAKCCLGRSRRIYG